MNIKYTITAKGDIAQRLAEKMVETLKKGSEYFEKDEHKLRYFAFMSKTIKKYGITVEINDE